MDSRVALAFKSAFLLALVFASACSRKVAFRVGEPNEGIVIVAAEAVDRFHTGLNEERYQEACQNTEIGAFPGVTDLRCAEFLAYLHKKLGEAMSTKRVQLPTIEVLPHGAAVRMEIKYETHYDRAVAQERFNWRVDGPKVTLISYTVKADALSH